MSQKTILLRCGLSNRLRTIAGYTYIGFMTGDNFVFHWDMEDRACNGGFNSIFEAFIPRFNRTAKRIEIVDRPRDPDINYYFIGQDTIDNIIRMETPTIWANKVNVADIETDIYRYFIPKRIIRNKVNTFLRQFDKVRLAAAIHIRRTDHATIAKNKNRFTEDDVFKTFIEKNKHMRVFLATDSRQVQEVFTKYRNVVVYKAIDPEEIPKGKWCLRATTLENALIDILIAAVSKDFVGSDYSSYSHLIDIYHRVNQRVSKYFYYYL